MWSVRERHGAREVLLTFSLVFASNMNTEVNQMDHDQDEDPTDALLIDDDAIPSKKYVARP